MDYPSILDPIPWREVGITVLQSGTLYWIVLLGVKLVGRRVFGSMGPEDIIILVLVAEACDLGLTPEAAGYWGTVFSVITLLTMGYAAERIPFLKKRLEDTPIEILKNGTPLPNRMKHFGVEEQDLQSAAREYGLANYSLFSQMVLEPTGKITGVLNLEGSQPWLPDKHS